MKKYLIKIINENVSFYITEGEHIIKGISRYNPKHKANGCSNGGCGGCKIKIISGQYETKKWSNAEVSDEEFKEGYGLACRIFPKSDIEIEFIGR